MMIYFPWSRIVALLLAALLTSTAWAGEGIWIDVRTPAEYRAGHVAGAINIPLDEIGERIDEVNREKDSPVYLYCRTGNRSAQAKAILENMGYTRVDNFGGLDEAQQKAAAMAAQ
ncbi:MAG: rhodanese-like domain-containing protein [Xanthomonadales bacterium]|nr:rhodanese-like domain-containing protein [Xanthomonadales bacterium]